LHTYQENFTDTENQQTPPPRLTTNAKSNSASTPLPTKSSPPHSLHTPIPLCRQTSLHQNLFQPNPSRRDLFRLCARYSVSGLGMQGRWLCLEQAILTFRIQTCRRGKGEEARAERWSVRTAAWSELLCGGKKVVLVLAPQKCVTCLQEPGMLVYGG